MKESEEEDTDSGDELEEVSDQEVCLSEHVAILHCGLHFET